MRRFSLLGKFLCCLDHGKFSIQHYHTNSVLPKSNLNSESQASEIPVLKFLSDKKCLFETVAGTVEVCNALLEESKKSRPPQERHDFIDTASNFICLLLDPCEFVRQIHPDPEYKKYANEAFQRAYEYMCQINSNQDMYKVLVDLSLPESKQQMDSESNKNIYAMKCEMETNGIHLPDDRRKKVVELQIFNESLSLDLIKNKFSGNGLATLNNLLKCRYELSQVLGLESFADQRLRSSILKNQEKVWHFLCSVAEKNRTGAERELKILGSHLGNKGYKQITDKLRATIARSLENEVMPETLPEYFSAANCVRGIKFLCSEVFGVHLRETPFEEVEKYSPLVKKFCVHDADSNKFLGIIILDMLAGSHKLCSAGQFTLQVGCEIHQKAVNAIGLSLPQRQYPIVVLTCDAGSQISAQTTKKSALDDETTLMTFQEVISCFHEFGHAMHSIFGQTKVQNLAGTRGSIDFVEIFSQLFEQFMLSHDFLKLWATHYVTRKPISVDMVQNLVKARTMHQHLEILDQVSASAIDQTLHGPQPFTVYFPQPGRGVIGKRTLGDYKEYGKGIFNLAELIMQITRPISIIEPTETGVLKSLSFDHLATYAGGYYGYLYSFLIAKRIWEKKFQDDPVNRTAGKELIQKVMRFGSSHNPSEILENYLGEKLDNIILW